MSLQACKELPQQLQGRSVDCVTFDMVEEFDDSEQEAVEKEFESVEGWPAACRLAGWGGTCHVGCIRKINV